MGDDDSNDSSGEKEMRAKNQEPRKEAEAEFSE